MQRQREETGLLPISKTECSLYNRLKSREDLFFLEGERRLEPEGCLFIYLFTELVLLALNRLMVTKMRLSICSSHAENVEPTDDGNGRKIHRLLFFVIQIIHSIIPSIVHSS